MAASTSWAWLPWASMLVPSATHDSETVVQSAGFEAAWLTASASSLAICDSAGHVHWCNPAFDGNHPAHGAPGARGSLADRLQLAAADDDALRSVLRASRPATMQGQGRHRCAAGSVRTLLLHVLSLAADLRLVQVDVLLPEQADDPVARARAHLAEAIELAGVVIWQRDLESGTVRFNRQGALLFGFDPLVDLFPMESWRERIHPEDANRFFKVPRRAGRQSPQKETRFRLPDGQWGLLMATVVSQQDRQGKPQSLIGVALDVTERRRTELALRQAHESAALAAHSVGLGTWSMEVATEEVVWDEQMWRLRRLQPQEAPPVLDAMLQVVHADDRAAVERRLRQAPDAPAQTQSEFRIVWPDGTVRWLASRSAPVLDEHGKVLRRIGVNWDITDAREAERVRQERELAQRESRAKSDFLARMSHELRTPLNAIIGFSQLLLSEERGLDGNAAARRHRLQHVRSAGQQLLALINDVLDLSGLAGSESQLAAEPVALEPLVAEVAGVLAAASAERAVELSMLTLAAAPLADATRLRQVLRVLLARAIRQTRIGGRVTVSARSIDGRVRIGIQDQGPALSPQELRELFEPFSQPFGEPLTARTGEPLWSNGSALGLTMARAVVERMSGRLAARAPTEGGMLLEIDLPDASPRAAAPPSVDRSAGAAGATVLYIEDNPVNALIVRELIARRGDIVLHIAGTGAEGVALAEQLRPRLILLDMQLPDFDGFEVLRRLQASPLIDATQVIALSANAMPHDIERALAAGISAYWTKPLDFSGFMRSLDAIFGSAPEA